MKLKSSPPIDFLEQKNPKPKIKKNLFKHKSNIVNFKNEVVGSITLENALWQTTLNMQIVHDVVLSQQASWRLSTKKTKGRGEVSGGGKKPWNQKGTGRARHGSIRSPIWRGGGVTFGPTGNENYRKKVNQKVFHKALKMIWTNCLENNKLIFWNDADLKNISTKKFIEILQQMKLIDQKILFIVDDQKMNLLLSLRNLKKISGTESINITPYDLLYFDKILVFDKLLPLIEKSLI